MRRPGGLAHDPGTTRGLYMMLVLAVAFACLALTRMSEQGAELARLRQSLQAATDERDTHRSSVTQHAGSIRALKAKLDSCEARLKQYNASEFTSLT